MSPDTLAALRRFPDIAPVAALLVVLDLADAALRAAHPGLRIEPNLPASERRALILLRSIQRIRRDAARYVEYHADLVGIVPPRVNHRHADVF